MNGKRTRARKMRESSLGGLFSGALNMWDISALGPNLEVESIGCGGGRAAFSGGSGRSNSIEPSCRKNEFSWRKN